MRDSVPKEDLSKFNILEAVMKPCDVSIVGVTVNLQACTGPDSSREKSRHGIQYSQKIVRLDDCTFDGFVLIPAKPAYLIQG